jgi:hypothetical protein
MTDFGQFEDHPVKDRSDYAKSQGIHPVAIEYAMNMPWRRYERTPDRVRKNGSHFDERLYCAE